MQAVKEWVGTIISVAILASLVEMIMPGSEMRRYVRVVLGFLVLAAVLGPMVATIGGGRDLLQGLEVLRVQQGPGQSAHLPEATQNAIASRFERSLAESIMALLKSHKGLDADVQVRASYNDSTGMWEVQGVTVRVVPGESSRMMQRISIAVNVGSPKSPPGVDDTAEIRTLLWESFGLEPRVVTVIEGGSVIDIRG